MLYWFAAEKPHKGINVIYEFVDAVLVDVDCFGVSQLQATV